MVCALVPAASIAVAQPRTRAVHQPFVEVRLSLSRSAGELVAPQKFRRYLTIELEDAGHVAANAYGPLSDHVGYVWIDLPEPGRVRVQVRVGRHRVSTRTFALREGLRPDVAARLVAIATSEMVRAQARPERARKRVPRKPPTPEQVELATRNDPAVLLTGNVRGAWMPSIAAWLGGSALELSLRSAKTRQHIGGAWLAGPSDAGPVRWFEAGLGVDRTWWLSPLWRVDLGVGAYGATALARDAIAVDRVRGQRDAWTVRTTGRVKVDRTLGGQARVGLSLEPGLLLRTSSVTTSHGERDLGGFFLGVNWALTVEQRFRPVASERL